MPNGGEGQGEGEVIFSEQKVRQRIWELLDDVWRAASSVKTKPDNAGEGVDEPKLTWGLSADEFPAIM